MPDLEGFTLYHRAGRDVRGDRLLPLNALRRTWPDVYAREVRKYEGREALRDSVLPDLACGWGDVLFLSPVDPGPLLDVLRAAGHAAAPVRFWTLPAAALDPEHARVLLPRPWPGGVFQPHAPDDLQPFMRDVLAGACVPPAATLARLRALPPGAPLLLWADVPHVLYRGSLPLSLLREVRR